MFSSANTGDEFADPDVVRCYAFRPAYPAALHQRLVELAPRRGHLLDLGCGPGKLAIALAPQFDRVTAVDPSHHMLEAAQASQSGTRNTRWIRGRAEDFHIDGPFDLIVVGAAIHWMRLDQVMPRLRQALSDDGVLALVDGDAPAEAPWIEAYRAHNQRWVEKGGVAWRGPARPAHLEWMQVHGSEAFTATAHQSVNDFIEAEHSRATWSRAKMGDEAGQFDRELRELLSPHVSGGMITYTVQTSLLWGQPLLAAG